MEIFASIRENVGLKACLTDPRLNQWISYLKWEGNERSPRIRFNFSVFQPLVANLSGYLGNDDSSDDATLVAWSSVIDEHLLGSGLRLTQADIEQFWGMVDSFYSTPNQIAYFKSAGWFFDLALEFFRDKNKGSIPLKAELRHSIICTAYLICCFNREYFSDWDEPAMNVQAKQAYFRTLSNYFRELRIEEVIRQFDQDDEFLLFFLIAECNLHHFKFHKSDAHPSAYSEHQAIEFRKQIQSFWKTGNLQSDQSDSRLHNLLLFLQVDKIMEQVNEIRFLPISHWPVFFLNNENEVQILVGGYGKESAIFEIEWKAFTSQGDWDGYDEQKALIADLESSFKAGKRREFKGISSPSKSKFLDLKREAMWDVSVSHKSQELNPEIKGSVNSDHVFIDISAVC